MIECHTQELEIDLAENMVHYLCLLAHTPDLNVL